MKHLRGASTRGRGAAFMDAETTSYGIDMGAIRINTRVRTATQEPCVPLPHVRANSAERKSIWECGPEGSLPRHRDAARPRLRVVTRSLLRSFVVPPVCKKAKSGSRSGRLAWQRSQRTVALTGIRTVGAFSSVV